MCIPTTPSFALGAEFLIDYVCVFGAHYDVIEPHWRQENIT